MVKQPPSMTIKSPFPYYGGKSRWAEEVWLQLGHTDVYAEPFAGSLACLLLKPKPSRREVVCDTNSGLVNAWRSIQHESLETAKWAEACTFHDDLTARHKWLLHYFSENAWRFAEDPDYYDCKAAGWWLWGMSNWIGGDWCTYSNFGKVKIDRVPHTSNGQGVQQQRMPYDGRPAICNTPYGRGLQASDDDITPIDGYNGLPLRQKIIQWFNQIQKRFRNVIVLNRDWESALTPSVLCQTNNGRSYSVTVVLDPPYLTASRSKHLYISDIDGSSSDVAIRSYKWAVEHGNKYRIAYFCHENDFKFPDGWTCQTKSFHGVRKISRKDIVTDMVAFSPATREWKETQQLF